MCSRYSDADEINVAAEKTTRWKNRAFANRVQGDGMPRAARPTSMPIFKLKNMFTGKWASRRRTAALVVVKAMRSVKIYGLK